MTFILVLVVGIVAGIVGRQLSRPHLDTAVAMGLGSVGAFAGAFIAHLLGVDNSGSAVFVAAILGAASFLAALRGLTNRKSAA